MKKIAGYILSFVAWLLTIITKPILTIYTWIKLHNFSKIDDYYMQVADIEDNAGNVRGQHLWNAIFIKPDGYKFGNPADKISFCLAKNKQLRKLRIVGKAICWVLIKLNDPAFAVTK
jgi:8-oxo-dGTP diphosphatase